MISLIIKDGLGNQLFQYAYARYLQEIYSVNGEKETIIINPYYIDRYDFRKVSLQNFVLNENVEFLQADKQKRNMNRFTRRVVFANGMDIIPWKVLKTRKPLGEGKYIKRSRRGLYYTYQSQTEYRTVLSECRDKFVFGCFQGEANFSPIADLLRDEFEIKAPPTEPNKAMLSRICSDQSVCLHIRRGDYLDPRWKDLQICTFEYYNRAINEVLKAVESPVFYVFSNTHEDLEWIRENYIFSNEVNDNPLQFVYVDLNNPDYEELRLMKNCKHFIISNSTFSWWAAYLSNYEEKNVFVPERWNLGLADDDRIYLKKWIKVSTK